MSKTQIEAILIDLGDVIMNEETEVKDENQVTQKAELVSGAKKTLKILKERGYKLGLVADTKIGTYKNVLSQHEIYSLFDTFSISEEMGCSKPNPRMFRKALNDLNLDSDQFHKVLMVGNNLEVDIVGANRMDLISVWSHWNDRRKTKPDIEEEVPDFTIGKLPELLTLIDKIEARLNTDKAEFDREIVKKFAPPIYFDKNEPFLPVLIGGTIVNSWQPSLSFPRLLWPPESGYIIEYAIYWDWDIGHHYELEHIWLYIKEEEIVRVEASLHGMYSRIYPYPAGREEFYRASYNHNLFGKYLISDKKIKVEENLKGIKSDEVQLVSQPGKHAFAPDYSWFEDEKVFAYSCKENAGIGGLISGVYKDDRLHKGENRDYLTRNYLSNKSFEPAFAFTQKIKLREMVEFVSWPDLYEIIPKRVNTWMEALAQGKEPEPGNLKGI
ncbi:MAG: HAD family hydrolase [Bacillota bacterium]